MKKNTRVGFLGAGKMGEALIAGLLASRAASPGRIIASDKNSKRLADVARRYRIRAARDNAALAAEADVLVLAAKPQDIRAALRDIAPALRPGTIVISIAAGIRVDTIIAELGPDTRVIRAMPNVAAVIREGATGMFAGPGVTARDEAAAAQIFASVGIIVSVREESLLDAVTGLSGSGPAYVFLVLDALSDAGVRMGLARDAATALAIQTVQGAARMAASSGKSFSELKNMVTSPGGTTIEGLKKLEERRVRAAFMEAVEAAAIRAAALSGG